MLPRVFLYSRASKTPLGVLNLLNTCLKDLGYSRPTPTRNPTLTIASYLEQNVGFGEGEVGSFSRILH